MSEKMSYRNTPSALAISAASPPWPAYLGASYETLHSRPSYCSLNIVPHVVKQSFGQQVAEIYALLLEGQEPLGGEFEAIWDANVGSLYEA